MAEMALVFGIDAAGRVRHARELRFTSRADLLRQLEPVVEQHPLVEAWNGAICTFRKGRLARPDPQEDEAGAAQ